MASGVSDGWLLCVAAPLMRPITEVHQQVFNQTCCIPPQANADAQRQGNKGQNEDGVVATSTMLFFYSKTQIEIIRCNNEKAGKLLYSKNKSKKEKPLMSLPCGSLLQSDRPAVDVAPPTLNVSSPAKMSHNVPALLPSRQSAVCPSAAEKHS